MIILVYACATRSTAVNSNIVTHRQAGHIKGGCTTACDQTKLNSIVSRRMGKISSTWWSNKRPNLA